MKNLLLLIIMSVKLLTRGALLLLLTCGPIMANTSEAQVKSIDEVFITLERKSYSLFQFFKATEKQTDFKFFYTDKVLNNKKLDFTTNRANVEEFLIEIAKQTDLRFKQVNNAISVIIAPKENHGEDFVQIDINLQDIMVQGTVTDENGGPLPGVTVSIPGTSVGTATDINGKYTLSVPEGATLAFSFIGFETQEIQVGSQSVINVTLSEDMASLDEVVVVAYGTQQKKDLTSSITSLRGRDLGNMPVASADALLQGKAAGVQVVQNTGMPGGEVFVRIRGSNTLYGDSRPLFVIDGVPMTNMNTGFLGGGGHRQSGLADINPNDIESIEILKDAAAAALYGSRGSNGVVLITTKRGRSGDAQVSFDAYYGVQEVSRTFDMLGGQEFIDVVNESRLNSNNAPFPEHEYTGVETDWQDEVFRTAPIANYSLSVSGGSDRLTAFTSVNYFKQQGTLIGQDFERMNGRLNMDYQANKWLKVGNNTTFTNVRMDRIDNDFSGYSVLANALFFNPNVPVRNPDGTYGRAQVPAPIVENPVMIANDLHHEVTTRRVISNVYGEVNFLENFTMRSTFGIDYMTRREERFVPSYFVRQLGLASAQAVAFDEMVWQNENTLMYNNSIGDHTFGGLLGYSMLGSVRSNLVAGGNTAASDIITTIAIAVPDIPSHNIGMWGLQSYFSRVNYSFRDKYLFEASMRIDGSSRFGRNYRYGYFPSLSGAWRVSEEPFMQPLSNLFSDLKIRASYGATGNQEGIDNFGSLTQYGANRNYDGMPGISKAVVGNVDLRWETTVSTNLGVDVSFLQGRFNLTADFYVRRTEDLFYPLALPFTTGFPNIPRVNLGDLENRGVELMLSTRNLTGEFTWSTDFNIAFNRNEITYLLETQGVSDRVIPAVDYAGSEGPYGLFRVGEPVGNFYGYNYLGVWGSEEEIPVEWGDRISPGDSRFEDVDGNFVFQRLGDHMIIGNSLPKHTGGITNNFAYKGLDLSVLFNWSYGNQIYNMTRSVLESMSRERNSLATVRDRWTPENPDGSIPRAYYGASSTSGAANTDASNRFVEDGSFLRLRNITLGYNLPAGLSDRLSLSNVRVYVSGQNLWTLTNYTGLDPENQNLGASQQGIPSLGVDFLTQPLPKVYMVGLNIGF